MEDEIENGDTVIEAEEGIVKGNAIILKDTCDAVRQFSASWKRVIFSIADFPK